MATQSLCTYVDSQYIRRDEQKRQTEAAIKLATPDNQLPNAVEYRQRLQESLNYDALCGYAWFNLGVLESQIGIKRVLSFPSSWLH
jgi:hypothetical protein